MTNIRYETTLISLITLTIKNAESALITLSCFKQPFLFVLGGWNRGLLARQVLSSKMTQMLSL